MAYENAVYARYCADFRTSAPAWPVAGNPLSIRRHPEIDDRCRTYVHITSEGSVEDERTPDLARCERISWPRLIIEEFGRVYPAKSSDRIAWWMSTRTTRRGVETSYVIALADFSYVVVLGARKGYTLLTTAYPVEYSSRRAKLQRECEEYWEKSGGRPD